MQFASVPAQLVDAGVPVVPAMLTASPINGGPRSHGRHSPIRSCFVSGHCAASRQPTAWPPNFGRLRHISNSARPALLADTHVDFSVGSTGELVLSGKTIRAPATAPPAVTHRSRRRCAAERVCVLTASDYAKLTLPPPSGSPSRLVQEREKEPLPTTPMTEAARRELLTRLSTVRADDGLVETYWYGIDPVVEQVRSAIRLGAELTVQTLSGGEVAADLLQPWPVPTRGLVYAEELLDLTDFGLVEATAQEATLTVRVPADPTVWTTSDWWRQVSDAQYDIATVDPVITLQDLNAGPDLGDGAPQR